MPRSREILSVTNVEELVEHVRPLTFIPRLRQAVGIVSEFPIVKAPDAQPAHDWRVSGKNTAIVRSWTFSALAEPVDPEDHSSVTIRARATHATRNKEIVVDEQRRISFFGLDFFSAPEKLAWRRTGSATLDLVLKGSYYRSQYEPALVTVDTPGVDPEVAGQRTLEVARVLTDFSYLEKQVELAPFPDYFIAGADSGLIEATKEAPNVARQFKEVNS